MSYYVEFWREESQYPEYLEETADGKIRTTVLHNMASTYPSVCDAAISLAKYALIEGKAGTWKYDTIEIRKGRPIEPLKD